MTEQTSVSRDDPATIVVLHAGGIGDLVQSLPALRAVRVRWPEARITLVGRPERAALAQMAGLVDAVADAETSGLWRLMGGRPPTAPPPPPFDAADLVVDLFSGGKLERALPGRSVIGVRPLPPDDWNKSAVTWLLQQVRPHLDEPSVPPEPEIAVSAEASTEAREALAPIGREGPFAAIHPGSGGMRKNWPLDRFAEVARRLRDTTDLGIAWLAGPAEMERGLSPPAEPGDAVLADWPLPRLAGALAGAAVCIGNDSGITHLAAAVRCEGGPPTPTVALFGPTNPRVWAPRGSHVQIVRSPDGTMEGIDVDTVWHAVQEALSGT